MWTSSDSKTPQSSLSDPAEQETAPASEINGKPVRVAPLAALNQHSMIGKSIVIKGEITGSDPLYIYGCVEGSISAPAHRVTVGKEGRVKADITAREVVIMGDVCGNLNSGDRVEIRSEGSLLGDLATRRIYIEEGAVLQGSVDIRRPSAKEKAEAQKKEPRSAVELEAIETSEEPEFDHQTSETLAVPELA